VQPIQVITGRSKAPIGQIRFSPDGEEFACVGDAAFALSTETSQMVWTLPGSEGAVAIAYSPDGKYIVVVDTTGSLCCFARPSYALAWTCRANDDDECYYQDATLAFCFDPPRVLWARNGSNSLRSVDVSSGEIDWCYSEPGHRSPTGRFFDVAASSDSGLIALARREHVLLLEGARGKPVDRLDRSRPRFGGIRESRRVEYSPSGHILAVGEWFGLTPWNVVERRPRFSEDRFLIEDNTAIAFCPDRNVLAATSGVDRLGWIWNLDDGNVEEVLQGADEQLSAVGWSPRNDVIVTGSFSGVLRVYSAQYRPFSPIDLGEYYRHPRRWR